ncbi:MAG: hypothetical protein KC506_01845 [Nanoarchaeota archaeon]|nr:hypothetical protein [Nanoarchaeota archaeon]
MERRNLIWLIVITAFVILTIWALVVIFDSTPKESDGPPGVVITNEDNLPNDSAIVSDNEIGSFIEDEIVNEEDDLDLGEVV